MKEWNELSERLSTILADYMKENNLQPGKDIFFLISADANHYGQDFNNIPFGEDEKAHRQGTEQDRRFAQAAFSGPLNDKKIRDLTQELWGATYKDYRNTYWCGKYDIPFGLLTISKTMQKAVGRETKRKNFSLFGHLQRRGYPVKKSGIRHHRPLFPQALGGIFFGRILP